MNFGSATEAEITEHFSIQFDLAKSGELALGLGGMFREGKRKLLNF